MKVILYNLENYHIIIGISNKIFKELLQTNP